MKKLIVLLAFLLSSFAFSQEITMQGHKYFVNGEQISSRDVKAKIASNEEALKLFKSGKNKASLGGMFLGLGVAFCTADLVKGLVSDEDYPGPATYIGAGLLVVSVPILIGKNKKMRQGIETYNAGLKNSGDADDFELNLITNQNGYGIQLRF
jgi:hypothetical protein